jgi:hypothetical protein
MKDLLLNKIPDTFLVLRHNGALKEGALERLMHTWVNRLGPPVGNFLGLVLTFAIFWFYNLHTWGEWQRIYRMDFWSAALKMGPEIIDLLLAYAGGVALWILMVTAWKFYYLGRIGELNIRPFHPDRCEGLGSIGQLLFFSSLILVVIALFSGGWLLSGKGNPDIDPAFRAFQQWLAGTLLWVGVVSIAVFFVPLIKIHGIMKVEAVAHRSKALPLVAQISDLEESLIASASLDDYEELNTRLTKIEALRNAYLHCKNIPTWPVDLQTRWQFLTAQLALWISVLTLSEKIKAALFH